LLILIAPRTLSQEYGMPKSDIATISPLLMLVGLMVPTFTGSLVTARTLILAYRTFGHAVWALLY
jgi:hypothetical protein